GRRGERPFAPTHIDPTASIRFPAKGQEPRSLSSLIAGFKAATTTRINQHRQTPGVKIWQRNYYEHIIRTQDAYNRICEYIQTNPARWQWGRENPAYTPPAR
ncbi:MAG: transposase, partial [Anaerolineae bacterium]|nr:transposase [Anaerolineae bacterium]